MIPQKILDEAAIRALNSTRGAYHEATAKALFTALSQELDKAGLVIVPNHVSLADEVDCADEYVTRQQAARAIRRFIHRHSQTAESGKQDSLSLTGDGKGM
jgi:hypothetical protein